MRRESKFEIGQMVTVELRVNDVRTTEERVIADIDSDGVWLDNGPGNRMSGPYHPITGAWHWNGVLPGSHQRIVGS